MYTTVIVCSLSFGLPLCNSSQQDINLIATKKLMLFPGNTLEKLLKMDQYNTNINVLYYWNDWGFRMDPNPWCYICTDPNIDVKQRHNSFRKNKEMGWCGKTDWRQIWRPIYNWIVLYPIPFQSDTKMDILRCENI